MRRELEAEHEPEAAFVSAETKTVSPRWHYDCERCFANRRCDGGCGEMMRLTDETLAMVAEPASESLSDSDAPTDGPEVS